MVFKNKYWLPLALALCLLLGFASATLISTFHAPARGVNIFEKTKTECPGLKWVEAIDSSQRVLPIDIGGELYFAGERVPLEDPEVKERLDRELQLNGYWRSNTLLCMKMANRYFPDIEQMLIDSGVPTDFKYLALIESGFRYDVSPAGAVGFWQFIKETAKSYDLEVNDEVDERYNTDKSTLGAIGYLKEAKEHLGNWTLAATSYNLGLAATMQKVKDQRVNNYYDMYFNVETSRYIFRMIAFKIIFSNPEKCGFYVQSEDLYQPYKSYTVTVDSTIANIGDFAAQFGLKYKHIKMLNPWLRNASLTNRMHKKYEIKILELN